MHRIAETKGKSKLLDREKDTEIQFLNADILNLQYKDWRDGDVIFCNSTCFDEIMMNKFCDRASKWSGCNWNGCQRC